MYIMRPCSYLVCIKQRFHVGIRHIMTSCPWTVVQIRQTDVGLKQTNLEENFKKLKRRNSKICLEKRGQLLNLDRWMLRTDRWSLSLDN